MSDEKDKRSTNGNGSTNGEQKRKRGRPPKAQTKEAEPAKAPNQAKEKKLERFSIRSIMGIGVFEKLRATSIVEDFLFTSNKNDDGFFAHKNFDTLRTECEKYRKALLDRKYLVKEDKQSSLEAAKLDDIAALLILTFTAGGFEEIIEKGYSGKIIYDSKIKDRIKEYILEAECTEKFFRKRKDKGIDFILDYSNYRDEREDKIALRMLVALLILAFDVDVPENIETRRVAEDTYEALYAIRKNEKHCKKDFPIPSMTNWDRSQIICELAKCVAKGGSIWASPSEKGDGPADKYIDKYMKMFKKLRVYTAPEDDDSFSTLVEPTFDDIYVDAPVTKQKVIVKKDDKGKELVEMQPNGVDHAENFLRAMPHRVHLIEANAGKGKTTLLQHLFNSLAAEVKAAKWDVDKPFPIWIDRDNLPDYLLSIEYKCEDKLKDILEAVLNEEKEFVGQLLRHKDGLVIFIDGLDEFDARTIVDAIKQTFVGNAPNPQAPTFVIGSRPNVLRAMDDKRELFWRSDNVCHYVLNGLDDEDCFRTYVHKLFTSDVCQEEGGRTEAHFLAAIEQKEKADRRYRETSRTPLTLPSIAQRYLRSGELPRHHIEALDNLVQSIFVRDHDKERAVGGRREKDHIINDHIIDEEKLLDTFCMILAVREYYSDAEGDGKSKTHIENEILEEYLDKKERKAFDKYKCIHHLFEIHANIKDFLIARGAMLLYLDRDKSYHTTVPIERLPLIVLIKKSAVYISNVHFINKLWEAEGESVVEEKGEKEKADEEGDRAIFIMRALIFCSAQKKCLPQVLELLTKGGFDYPYFMNELGDFLFESIELLPDEQQRLCAYETLCEILCEIDAQCVLRKNPDNIEAMTVAYKLFKTVEEMHLCESKLVMDVLQDLPFRLLLRNNPYDDLFYYTIVESAQSRKEIRNACENLMNQIGAETVEHRLQRRLLQELVNTLNGVYLPTYPDCIEYEPQLQNAREQREGRRGLIVLSPNDDSVEPLYSCSFSYILPPLLRLRCLVIPRTFVKNLDPKRYANLRMILVEEGNPLYKMEEGCLVKKTDDGWALVWFPNCSSICIPACVTELETSILKDNEFLDEVSVHSDNQRFKAIEGKYLIDKREQTLVACTQSSELLCLPCDDDLRRIETGFFDALWGVDELRLSSSVVAIEIGSVYFRKLYMSISVNIVLFDVWIMASTLEDIVYEGTRAQWNRIIIETNRLDMFEAESSDVPDDWRKTSDYYLFFGESEPGFSGTKYIRVYCDGDNQTFYIGLKKAVKRDDDNISYNRR